MSGSTSTYSIIGSALYLHPDWTGFNNPSINDDVAIVELSSEFPSDVPIYALNDVPFDDVVTAYFVGYGRSGNGIDGYTTSTSSTVKRWGMNDIDYFFTDDEGSGARETFQFDFDFPDSPDSLGNDRETTLGSGDSGGPSFIEDGNGGFKLFGINTYTTQFSPSSPTAPYFGSGGGGMVIAAYVDFIDSIVNPAEVVDRRIFYNGSEFDGFDGGGVGTDDDAIAPDPDELAALGANPNLGKTALSAGPESDFQ